MGNVWSYSNCKQLSGYLSWHNNINKKKNSWLENLRIVKQRNKITLILLNFADFHFELGYCSIGGSVNAQTPILQFNEDFCLSDRDRNQATSESSPVQIPKNQHVWIKIKP